MDPLSRSKCCVVTFLAFVILINQYLDCSPPVDDDLYTESRRFRDVPRALNFIHELLTDHVPLVEKCKRYAVLLAMAAATGLPHEQTVRELIALDDRHLDIHYQAIDVNSLSSLYMCATERYRVNKLAPPFLEILQCLESINNPAVKVYLDDPELKTIVNIYRRVLGLNDTETDLEGLDMSMFHPAFVTNLRLLFGALLDFDHLCATSQVRLVELDASRHPSDLTTNIESSSSHQHDGNQLMSGKDNKEEYLAKCRERARLAQRRLRMLEPDRMREQNRKHKRQYRARKRQLEGRQKPHLTPEEKRIQRLERRRLQRQSKRMEKLEEHKYYLLLEQLLAEQPKSCEDYQHHRARLLQLLADMYQQEHPQLQEQQPEQVVISVAVPDPANQVLPPISAALSTNQTEQEQVRSTSLRQLVDQVTSFTGFGDPTYQSYLSPSPFSSGLMMSPNQVPGELMQSDARNLFDSNLDHRIDNLTTSSAARGGRRQPDQLPFTPHTFGAGGQVQKVDNTIDTPSMNVNDTVLQWLVSPPPPEESVSTSLHEATSSFSDHKVAEKGANKQHH